MEQAQVTVRGMDPLTVAGLVRLLRTCPDITMAEDRRETAVDVVVVAVDAFSADEAALLHETAAETGKPIVLVCNEVDYAKLCVAGECRVVAILSRRAATDGRLAQSIRSAAKGGGKILPILLRQLLAHVERLNSDLQADHDLAGPGLTGREVEILRLLADGLDTRQIAGTMNYSERTIKNIIKTITTRLNRRNRPHAVACAMRAGLI